MAIVTYRRRARTSNLARRSAAGRKRYGKRRMIRRRPSVYYFKQTYYKTSALQLTDTSPTLSTFSFTASTLGNMPAFQAIYDQYSIRKVVIKFIPKFNMMASTVSSSVNFTTVIDYDDPNPLPNAGAAWQYQTCKMTRGTQVHTRTLVPCANSIFDAAGSAGLSPKKAPWLDISNLNVLHYGVKLGCEQLPSGAAPLDYDVQIQFYLAFKNVR